MWPMLAPKSRFEWVFKTTATVRTLINHYSLEILSSFENKPSKRALEIRTGGSSTIMAIPMLILPKEIRYKVTARIRIWTRQVPNIAEPGSFSTFMKWSSAKKKDIRLQLSSIPAEEQRYCQTVPVKFRTLSTKTNWSIEKKISQGGDRSG